MQNLYYFRSTRGGRLLFGACEISRIEIVRSGAIIYSVGGCPYHVVSRYAELVVKEPAKPQLLRANERWFNRYEKFVEDG